MKLIYSLVFLGLILVLNGCKKEEEQPAKPVKPNVVLRFEKIHAQHPELSTLPNVTVSARSLKDADFMYRYFFGFSARNGYFEPLEQVVERQMIPENRLYFTISYRHITAHNFVGPDASSTAEYTLEIDGIRKVSLKMDHSAYTDPKNRWVDQTGATHIGVETSISLP
ncbi:hypothetical protein [Hymenobacter metallicola]|uniref:Uncharacterized protein n=1 Tax=Hymenobacter metallicola TaxID=2563114 RepID=A0A4Z0QKW4_9BACT|nr:hypothetical protein [Hymenobacter metallicola]TGE29372.1 hypothetical protein E5K02_07935 [Hymenobacter metallicola]